jgi:hypothetical protein
MPHPPIDRAAVRMQPLAARENRKRIERDAVRPGDAPRTLCDESRRLIDECAGRIEQARLAGRPVILAFGAHTIKNGLAPLLIDLIERGWVTHLATNGAGVIHDWEFAFQGATSEDVRAGIANGTFGHWEETGFTINLAINVGAFEGKGYGESVGALIEHEGLTIPSSEDLTRTARAALEADPDRAGAAADLLGVIRRFGLKPGRFSISHPHKSFSIQAAAWRLGVALTGHPMIGHDIIYNHSMNHGALLGRAALRDYLTFAEAVSRIEGGVFISVGSAVMSPMIFEKSFSMAQNLVIQQGRRIENHYLCVVDLAASHWDWSRGEPPENNPDYYLRYNKTFNRMGGTMRYIQADNRDFLLALGQRLQGQRTKDKGQKEEP